VWRATIILATADGYGTALNLRSRPTNTPSPTAYLPLKYDQLLPKRGILCFKSAPGLEERGTRFKTRKISAAIAPDLK
jgi:hypothetical protein